MNNDNIRIALIGCGNMGNYYAHNLSRMKDVSIVSCCDPSQEKLKQFCEKWKVPHGTTEWRDLIPLDETETGIDGIINCSIDKLHEEIFQAAARSSVPLLSEKPFAVPFETLKKFSPDELENQKFLINFSKRTIPAIAAAKAFLKKGGLGKIHRMELHYRQGWVLNHDYGDWHDTSAWFWRLTEEYSHHGVLGDLGSHLFDLASFFCGSVETVSCCLKRIHKGREEYKGQRLNSMDDAHCFLEMEDGVAVLINATRTTAGEKDGLQVLISGEKGSIRLMPEESKDSYRLFLIDTGEWQTITCPAKPQRNHEHFIELIRTGKKTDFPGIREALYNHVMIEAAMKSNRKGCRIAMNSFGEENLGEIWQKVVMAK